MKLFQRLLGLLLTLTTVLLVFAACESDPSNTSGTTAADTTTAPAATAPITTEPVTTEPVTTEPVTTEPVTEDQESTNPESTPTPSTTPTPSVDTGYEQIKCREPDGLVKTVLGDHMDGSSLMMNLPKEWSFMEKNPSEYTVKRHGTVIGSLHRGEVADENWVLLKTENKKKSGISYAFHIERDQSKNEATYRYRIPFRFSDGNTEICLTLCVDYAELSAFSKIKLQSSIGLKSPSDDLGFGMLSKTHAKQSVLILGNSFVNSSQIGSILRQMVSNNGKSMEVTAISIGMANLSTFAGRQDILSDLRQGKYGALFLCGFYSTSQVESIDVIRNACNASGTALVIFPAHNENNSAIDSAISRHDDTYVLNWKWEIDTLIQNGIDRAKMCVNDTHNHSTPLAGYVGAHMIYRAVYGTVPKGSVSVGVSQSTVDSTLGSYAKTGAAYLSGNVKSVFFE